MSRELEDIPASELDRIDFDLVDFRRGGTQGRPVLDVRIDRRDGQTVTIDDCARVSRALEARLDAGGVIGGRYVLEVSSPGVERPLKRAADWHRFVGRRVSVNSEALGGRIEADLLAVEGEPGAEVVVVRDGRGEERRVPLAMVKDARLVFQWNKQRGSE